MSDVCSYPLGDGRYCANGAGDGHIYCAAHRQLDPLAQQLDEERVMSTPPTDPLAELQELHAWHHERHRSFDTTCDPERCRSARWLALCDRLAATGQEVSDVSADNGLPRAARRRIGCPDPPGDDGPVRSDAETDLWIALAGEQSLVANLRRGLDRSEEIRMEQIDRLEYEFGKKLAAAEHQRDKAAAALEILADNEYADTEIGMICIVCQRDPERLRTGLHESDCWVAAALAAPPATEGTN